MGTAHSHVPFQGLWVPAALLILVRWVGEHRDELRHATAPDDMAPLADAAATQTGRADRPLGPTAMTGSIPALSEKIQGAHRDRLVVVYVRQSTLQQVEHHQESTRLQYALVERTLALGWPRERIAIIDEDIGRSAASATGHLGFQRLIADVGLGCVGLVLCIFRRKAPNETG